MDTEQIRERIEEAGLYYTCHDPAILANNAIDDIEVLLNRIAELEAERDALKTKFLQLANECLKQRNLLIQRQADYKELEAERDKYKADYERCAKDAQRLAKLLAEEETLVDKYKADRDRISESADECHRLFTKVAKERDKYKEALEEIASMPDNRSTHWEDCPHNTCIAARALREP
jgi:chromosome segregation ATPase